MQRFGARVYDRHGWRVFRSEKMKQSYQHLIMFGEETGSEGASTDKDDDEGDRGPARGSSKNSQAAQDRGCHDEDDGANMDVDQQADRLHQLGGSLFADITATRRNGPNGYRSGSIRKLPSGNQQAYVAPGTSTGKIPSCNVLIPGGGRATVAAAAAGCNNGYNGEGGGCGIKIPGNNKQQQPPVGVAARGGQHPQMKSASSAAAQQNARYNKVAQPVFRSGSSNASSPSERAGTNSSFVGSQVSNGSLRSAGDLSSARSAASIGSAPAASTRNQPNVGGAGGSSSNTQREYHHPKRPAVGKQRIQSFVRQPGERTPQLSASTPSPLNFSTSDSPSLLFGGQQGSKSTQQPASGSSAGGGPPAQLQEQGGKVAIASAAKVPRGGAQPHHQQQQEESQQMVVPSGAGSNNRSAKQSSPNKLAAVVSPNKPVLVPAPTDAEMVSAHNCRGKTGSPAPDYSQLYKKYGLRSDDNRFENEHFLAALGSVRLSRDALDCHVRVLNKGKDGIIHWLVHRKMPIPDLRTLETVPGMCLWVMELVITHLPWHQLTLNGLKCSGSNLRFGVDPKTQRGRSITIVEPPGSAVVGAGVSATYKPPVHEDGFPRVDSVADVLRQVRSKNSGLHVLPDAARKTKAKAKAGPTKRQRAEAFPLEDGSCSANNSATSMRGAAVPEKKGVSAEQETTHTQCHVDGAVPNDAVASAGEPVRKRPPQRCAAPITKSSEAPPRAASAAAPAAARKNNPAAVPVAAAKTVRGAPTAIDDGVHIIELGDTSESELNKVAPAAKRQRADAAPSATTTGAEPSSGGAAEGSRLPPGSGSNGATKSPITGSSREEVGVRATAKATTTTAKPAVSSTTTTSRTTAPKKQSFGWCYVDASGNPQLQRADAEARAGLRFTEYSVCLFRQDGGTARAWLPSPKAPALKKFTTSIK